MAQPQPPAHTAESSVSPQGGVGEITVTAQRRAQTVQNIPYNISAVDGGALAKAGATSVNDIARVIPGLVTVDTGPATRGGTNNFVLRGLRADNPGGNVIGGDVGGQTVSTVSTYFGETPIFFPMQLKDIERVEVLRGPQGTLYGSGAEAGTIRFIPHRPQFDRTSGSINASGSLTEHSKKANGSVDGVLNLPLDDTLALRLVGGYERFGGFIDQVNLPVRSGSGPTAVAVPRILGDNNSGFLQGPIKRDTNSTDQWFLRGALRWTPSDRFDIQFDYLHQDTKADDVQASNPTWLGGTEDLVPGLYPNSSYPVREGGKYRATNLLLQPYENKVDLASLVATVDLGSARLTSASSYYEIDSSAISDSTPSYRNYGAPSYYPFYAGYPRGLAILDPAFSKEKSFVQEIRLVSDWDLPIDYVIGGYFQDQKNRNGYLTIMPGLDEYGASVGTPSSSPDIADSPYQLYRNTKFDDRAIFGELTWHIAPKWQVTGGVRFFWQKFSVNFRSLLPFGGSGPDNPSGLEIVDESSKFSDHILKLNTSYDVTPDLKLYATYSEGFRRGGANAIVGGAFASLPQYSTYEPDLAKNYEVGVKGSLFDRKLRFSGAIFLIDLSNFQFNANSPAGAALVYNGSKARSKGAELELTAQPTRDLLLSLGYAYTDAKVRKPMNIYDLPVGALLNNPPLDPILNISVPTGTQLPGVPKHIVTLAGDYTLPLGSGPAALHLHLDASYQSKSNGALDTASRFFWVIPSNFVSNARITYDSGEAWSVDLFVRNITNETGYSGGIGIQSIPNSYAGRYVMRPRTFGAGLHYQF